MFRAIISIQMALGPLFKIAIATPKTVAIAINIMSLHVNNLHISQGTKTFLMSECDNGTACFKKCEQLFEYQNLLSLTNIWWSKF
jgi:hypothetical protein